MAKKRKNDLIAFMDGLPWIIKIIFCIPALNIVYAVYRIIKGISNNDMVMLIIGILWIIPGVLFCWLIDLICTLVYKRPKFFA